MPSFSEAAARVLEQKRAGWRSWSHAQSWLSGLQRCAFPRIGKMPVSEVSSADVLEILAPIWQVKPDMAGKLRRHMRAVLEWAAAMELRIDNPCDRVGPVLGPQHKVVQHMRALPHRKVGAAMRNPRGGTGLVAAVVAAIFPVVAVSPSFPLLSFSPHGVSPGGNFPRPSGDRLHP